MSLEIYQSEDFLSQLKDAKQRGGIAAEAAKKAEQIVKALSAEMSNDPTVLFRYIGQQEHRIKNCHKIYLQGGYRLVFIHRDNCMICCFFGDHDECFRWVEANKRNKLLNKIAIDNDFYPVSFDCTSEESLLEIYSDSMEADLYDDLMNYETPPEKYEEDLFTEKYEKGVIGQLNSPEGQRVVAEWFRY